MKAVCPFPTNMPRLNAQRNRARWQDLEGKVHEETMTGMMATCLQHEMDHLEGILFIDHLSRLKRQMVLKKIERPAKWVAAMFITSIATTD